MPLCSCSVVPVAASLRRHGAGRGAVAAFLLSTPQTGIDSIFATYSLLGPVIAIFRPVSAFISGLVGGVLVDIMGYKKGETAYDYEKCEGECCSNHEDQTSKIVRALRHGFIVLPADLAGPIMGGLIIAGVINIFIPDNFFTGTFLKGLPGMLIMMAVGIPVYVCATGSVPIAAMMIAKGISPGAALVFLMTGPATNSATITAIWRILGKKSALLYLVAVAGTALASGLFLDYILNYSISLDLNLKKHFMLPLWTEILCSVILLFILLYSSRYGVSDVNKKKEGEGK